MSHDNPLRDLADFAAHEVGHYAIHYIIEHVEGDIASHVTHRLAKADFVAGATHLRTANSREENCPIRREETRSAKELFILSASKLKEPKEAESKAEAYWSACICCHSIADHHGGAQYNEEAWLVLYSLFRKLHKDESSILRKVAPFAAWVAGGGLWLCPRLFPC